MRAKLRLLSIDTEETVIYFLRYMVRLYKIHNIKYILTSFLAMFSAIAGTKLIVSQVHERMQANGNAFQNKWGQGKRTQNTKLDCMRMKLTTSDPCDNNSHDSGTWSCKNLTHREIDVFMKLLLGVRETVVSW